MSTLTIARPLVAEAGTDPHPAALGTGLVCSDGELLTTYLTSREDADFERLLVRFGPLVRSVTGRILTDEHLIDDVYQATFLTLVRDGHRIRKPDSVSAWLHGTALHIARATLRKNAREKSGDMVVISSDIDEGLRNLESRHERQIVDETLKSLPEKYRAPLVLHIVEGKSCEQTAIALNVSKGVVRGRLQRGTRELKRRLRQRGVTAPAFLLLAMAGSQTAQASVPAAINAQTTEWASVLAHHGSTALPSDTRVLLPAETYPMTGIKIAWAAAATAGAACLLSSPATQADILSPGRSTQDASPSIVRTEAADTDSGDESLLAMADTGGGSTKPVLSLKYGDSRPDGKKSIAGTGEAILFALPNPEQKLRSVRLHGSRYGHPQAPDEDVEVSVTSADGMDIIHTERVPYAKFPRGEARWNTVVFEDPLDVPEEFLVIFEFNAERTKGVYVSYDSSTDGSHSKTGVPGGELRSVSFDGDWMIQAVLTKP